MREELDRQCQITHEVLMHSPWSQKEFYAEWLAQTYFYVQHSTRLLCLSAARVGHYQNIHHLRMIDHMRE